MNLKIAVVFMFGMRKELPNLDLVQRYVCFALLRIQVGNQRGVLRMNRRLILFWLTLYFLILHSVLEHLFLLFQEEISLP